MKAEILNKPDVLLTLSWKEAKSIKSFIGGTSRNSRASVCNKSRYDDDDLCALYRAIVDVFEES